MSVIVEDWNEGQRYSAHKLSIFEKKKSGLTSVMYAIDFVRDAPPLPLPLLTLYRKKQRGKLGNMVEEGYP